MVRVSDILLLHIRLHKYRWDAPLVGCHHPGHDSSIFLDGMVLVGC